MKCAMVKRPYAPGRQGRSSFRRKLSDYGQQLAEKQKLRLWYGLSEKQFRRYVSEVLNKPKRYKNPGEGLVQKLESRLDNVIYRSGWAQSRSQARQMVVHGHFRVNGRAVDRPSFPVGQDQAITVKDECRDKPIFKNLSQKKTDKEKGPSCPWLQVDAKKMEIKMIRWPSLEEVNPPAQVSTILEFYTR